ncbi:hypothetical protein R83H12_00236 [Fibrobacteria bacterium R8-3-H12]
MTKMQVNMANRRMRLGFDFTDYLINNPSEIERLPNNFSIKDELEYLSPKEFVDELVERENVIKR